MLKNKELANAMNAFAQAMQAQAQAQTEMAKAISEMNGKIDDLRNYVSKTVNERTAPQSPKTSSKSKPNKVVSNKVAKKTTKTSSTKKSAPVKKVAKGKSCPINWATLPERKTLTKGQVAHRAIKKYLGKGYSKDDYDALWNSWKEFNA